MTRKPKKQDGSTGPHPRVGELPTYALIIRATTMPSKAARRQAYNALLSRGCWLAPEQLAAMERLGGV